VLLASEPFCDVSNLNDALRFSFQLSLSRRVSASVVLLDARRVVAENFTIRLTKRSRPCKVYRMVNYREESLDLVFKALGDPTRRQLLGRLSLRECSVSELAEPLKMTLPAVTKHIHVLERAGLVQRSKRGRTHYIRLDPRPLAPAHRWIDVYRRLCEEKFEKLDAYLAKKKSGEDAR
jgi:DNA-binding transcriptional ArsR family regulator